MRKFFVTVYWESEREAVDLNGEVNSQDTMQLAKDTVASFLPSGFKIKNVKIDPKIKKPKKKASKHLGEFSLQEVLDKVTNESRKVEFKSNGQSHFVRMNSQRYFVFKENNKCVSCGIEGVKFLLEQYPDSRTPHFNLYAIEDGELVLMTKDHIHARSSGGEDRHYNYQTMCALCNNLKGAYYIPLENLAKLKQIYKENVHLSKNKFNAVLKEAKEQLSIPKPKSVISEDSVVSKVDMNIMENEAGELAAVSVYETSEKYKEWKHIASIKKGFPFFNIVIAEDKILVPYDHRYFEVYKTLTTLEKKNESRS